MILTKVHEGKNGAGGSALLHGKGALAPQGRGKAFPKP